MAFEEFRRLDGDPVNIIFSAIRVALSDFVREHIATDLSDILFGTPQPILSEIICDAALAMENEAKAVGAKGINLVGICCTGNEVLMRAAFQSAHPTHPPNWPS